MPNTYLLYEFIFIFSAITLLLSILHLPCIPFYHTIPFHLGKTIWQWSANAQDQQKADKKCTKMAEDGLYSQNMQPAKYILNYYYVYVVLAEPLMTVCVLPSSNWQYENKILNCAYFVIPEHNASFQKINWSLHPCLRTYSIYNINCFSITTKQTIKHSYAQNFYVQVELCQASNNSRLKIRGRWQVYCNTSWESASPCFWFTGTKCSLSVAYQVDRLHCCMTNQGTCHLDLNLGCTYSYSAIHTHKVHLYRMTETSHTCPYISHDCMTFTTSFTQSVEPQKAGCLDVRNCCENAAAIWGPSTYGGIAFHCRGEYTEKVKQKYAIFGPEPHAPYPNTECQIVNKFRVPRSSTPWVLTEDKVADISDGTMQCSSDEVWFHLFGYVNS
jgi:hypothetical protein